MKLEHVILGLLSWRPFSGYELGKYLERELQFLRSKVHLSQIYRLLARMVDSGWIYYQVQENDGRPDAKVYRLTTEGELKLRAWVASPYEPSTHARDPEFMARFMFGGPLDRAALLRLVHTELDACRAQVVLYRDRNRSVGPFDVIDGVDESLIGSLNDFAHEHGAGVMDHWVVWLERVLACLEGEDASGLPGSSPCVTTLPTHPRAR